MLNAVILQHLRHHIGQHELCRTYGETQDIDVFSKNEDAFFTFVASVQSIIESTTKKLFSVFGIDVAKDVIQPTQNKTAGNINAGILQNMVANKTWRRHRLVFAYGSIAAGSCLFLMAILSMISRPTRWKPWPILRLIILITPALGTGLIFILPWFNSPSEELDASHLCCLHRCSYSHPYWR